MDSAQALYTAHGTAWMDTAIGLDLPYCAKVQSYCPVVNSATEADLKSDYDAPS